MGGNGGRPHLSAVTTWPKLISFPFPGMGHTLCKRSKTGFVSLSCLLAASVTGWWRRVSVGSISVSHTVSYDACLASSLCLFFYLVVTHALMMAF